MSDISPATPNHENAKLNVFIGKWHTTGDIYGKDGKITGHVNATDTYAWLPGSYAMMHNIDNQLEDKKTHGIEIIGYDTTKNIYFVSFFDDQGATGCEELRLDDGT